MPLLWYKDPADGQFKPYVAPTQEEVEVGPTPPAGPEVELWMDTNPTGPGADFDARYVKKSGDTMTGLLTTPQGQKNSARGGEARHFLIGAFSVPNTTNIVMSGIYTAQVDDKGDGVITHNGTSWFVSEAGYYDITAYVNWAVNATGVRRVEIMVSAASYLAQSSLALSSIGTSQVLSANSVWLNQSQYVNIQVYQNSTAALNVSNGRFTMRKVLSS